MKKLTVVLISVLMVLGLTACSSSSGSISGVAENENRYVVTFENAQKDMSVSTELTLEEDQVINFNHDLQTDDSVLIEFKTADGEVAMDVEVSDGGGGQTYIAPGTYTTVVTVQEKANGTLTLEVADIQKDDAENPWKMTQDIQEALDATGVDFQAPIDEALPGDVKFFSCFYTEDIFQINFSNDENELYMRVSKNHEGKEDLAGDYNEYEKTWHESVKGVDVTCYGEEDSIHLATFTAKGQNYSINYNVYREGPGMTVDELNSLLMGM